MHSNMGECFASTAIIVQQAATEPRAKAEACVNAMLAIKESEK
jgi:hypothetical protein